MITHLWNGTKLIITTSEGSTEIDFSEFQGDTGPRGPQGPAGILYDEDGVVLEGLVREDGLTEVLDEYATESYVSAQIAKAQLAGSDAEINLDAYATVDYVDDAIAAVEATVPDINDLDMSDYYTKSEVDALLPVNAEEVRY